jgi:hypothetical protein
MKPNLKWAAVAVGCAGIAAAAFVGGRAWAAGGIPPAGALNYSGLLQDASGAPLSGTQYVEVKFWNDATASAAVNLLCDTGTPGLAPLTNGRFSIPLPDKCTKQVGANTGIWVEVFVGPTANAAGSLGRAKIGAVPFAVEAAHAESASQGAAGSFAVPGALAVAGDATVAGKLSVGIHVSTNCTISGSITTCVCNTGEVAIAGGGNATTTTGNGYLASSRAQVFSPALTDTWQVGCKSDTGVPIPCSVAQVICARLAP